MLSVSKIYMIFRSIPRCEYIRCTPQTIYSANRLNGKLYDDIPGEDSVQSLRDSFLEKKIGLIREEYFWKLWLLPIV